MKPDDHARQDAKLYGVGFIVNGQRVDPRHVMVVRDVNKDVQKALAEYYLANENARHWPIGPNHEQAGRRLAAARAAVQHLLEEI